jgi:hypothetical protein
MHLKKMINICKKIALSFEMGLKLTTNLLSFDRIAKYKYSDIVVMQNDCKIAVKIYDALIVKTRRRMTVVRCLLT